MTDIVLDRVHVRQEYESADVDASLAVSFGVGNVQASNKTRSFTIRYEAMIESAPITKVTGDELWDDLYAIGVTLSLKVTNSNSAVKLDVFSVAAAIQLGLATAEFKTEIFPADSTVLAGLVPPEEGNFSFDKFDEIITGIGKVKEALGNSTTPLKPQRYSRSRGPASSLEQELETAQAVAFGMRELWKSKYVETCVEDAGNLGLNSTLASMVYYDRWDETREHVDPPGSVRDDAKKWLDVALKM